MRHAFLSTIPATYTRASHPRVRALPSLYALVALFIFASITSGCAHRPVRSPIVPPPPVTFSCSVSPASAYPGDPILVTAFVPNLDPARPIRYTWSAEGGVHIAGTSSTAAVETAGLAPGTYTVHGHAAQGSNTGQFAECTASFTVKAFEPPTVACSANPSTVAPGDIATITASGLSPQNRPLTYAYSASGGTITGTTSTATLSTAGAPPGPITVTCSTLDDHGNAASASTTVTVTSPPVASIPTPTSQSVGTIGFERNRPIAARAGEISQQLNMIAILLQRSPGAALAIVGNAAVSEKDSTHTLAEHRALSILGYLVGQEGVDASRLLAYAGSANSASVDLYLIPAGAVPNIKGTPVDTSQLNPAPRVPVAGNTNTSTSTPTSTTAPASACKGFAAFLYPRVFDLGDPGTNALQLHLYVGPLKALEPVFADLCGGARVADLICSQPIIAAAKAAVCTGASALTLPSSQKGRAYTLDILPIHKELSADVVADINLPSGVNRMPWPGGSQNLQDSFGYWNWKTEIKDPPSEHLPVGTIDLIVADANDHSSQFDSPSEPFKVPLKWPSIWDVFFAAVWRFLISDLGKAIGVITAVSAVITAIVKAGGIRSYVLDRAQAADANILWVFLPKLLGARTNAGHPQPPANPPANMPPSEPAQPPTAAGRPVVIVVNQQPPARDVGDNGPSRDLPGPTRRRPRHDREGGGS